MRKIVFCNTGWMVRYQGLTKSDALRGGGRFVTENKFGSELFNFKPFKGKMYGYVSSPINIQNLGANKDEEYVDDVLVIWVAGAQVVGWYKNARVYREAQEPPKGSKRIAKRGEECYYRISARAQDCHLLPVGKRTVHVPRKGLGRFGQKNVWYAQAPVNKAFREAAIKFVASGGRVNSAKKSGGGNTRRQSDPEARSKVEQRAIKAVIHHFRKMNYIVENRALDNCGWDLTATKDQTELQLEVKGLSGSGLIVELTPNEYAKMLSKQFLDSYRVCIVTEALSRSSKLSIFFHVPHKPWDHWQDEYGNRILIQSVQSARLKIAG